MILLDTHIWVWWINNSKELTTVQRNTIVKNSSGGLALSVISIWEVAKLVEKERIILNMPVLEWIEKAIDYSGIKVYPLSSKIIVESTELKGEFHNDPADQLIVATSITENIPILTADSKILKYSYVKKVM